MLIRNLTERLGWEIQGKERSLSNDSVMATLDYGLSDRGNIATLIWGARLTSNLIDWCGLRGVRFLFTGISGLLTGPRRLENACNIPVGLGFIGFSFFIAIPCLYLEL
jgi:hypothetical protein